MFQSIDYLMQDYWSEQGDPRVRHLPFMSSLWPLASLLTAYLAFVLHFGPRWMENRKPYSLRPLLIVYNLCMSLFNAHFVVRIMLQHNYGLDMFRLSFPSLDDQSESTRAIIRLHYLYTLSKVPDLCDTIFFVLRKKRQNVTGLHVYHHFSVPIQAWTYFRLCGNSAVVIPFGLFNSIIHTLMYAYYGLAAVGPWTQPYLWWKRYLTQLQIVQFVLLFLYGIYFSCFQSGYSAYISFNLIVQSIVYIWLFGRFYVRTYPRATSKQRVDDVNNNPKLLHSSRMSKCE